MNLKPGVLALNQAAISEPVAPSFVLVSVITTVIFGKFVILMYILWFTAKIPGLTTVRGYRLLEPFASLFLGLSVPLRRALEGGQSTGMCTRKGNVSEGAIGELRPETGKYE